MENAVLLVCHDAPFAAEVRQHLSSRHALLIGDSLESARLHTQSSPLKAVVAHLGAETLNGHTPGSFFSELQEAAGRAPIYALIDEDCPSRLRNVARNVVEKWFPLPLDYEALDALLSNSEGGDLAALDCQLPSKALSGRTRSLVTYTPSMFGVLDELTVAARHDVTVLLIGETGSGKTHTARLIHELSPRRDERFCPVACGALPAQLIESELFGYVRGAFTGAERDKPGKFAAAGRGTVLLDEIDVLPLEQQAKLLRVIETGEYEPVGSNDTCVSEARLIVASNVDLEDLVASGGFRTDLYYRLNVLRFYLPSLRDRSLDIEPLARNFAANYCREHRMPPLGFTADALCALRSYRWPGNIRELENVILRAVLYCSDRELRPGDLPADVSGAVPSTSAISCAIGQVTSLETNIGLLEQRLIEESLQRNNRHRAATARELGISRVTLYNKMKKFGMLS